jgi:hypothetical protein
VSGDENNAAFGSHENIFPYMYKRPITAPLRFFFETICFPPPSRCPYEIFVPHLLNYIPASPLVQVAARYKAVFIRCMISKISSYEKTCSYKKGYSAVRLHTVNDANRTDEQTQDETTNLH